MGDRQYPRMGKFGFRDSWAKKPTSAPFCMFPGCEARATHRPEVEVNWFRGDDESCGPVCRAHSTDPVLLLEATSNWRAAQTEKRLAAQQKKFAQQVEARNV